MQGPAAIRRGQRAGLAGPLAADPAVLAALGWIQESAQENRVRGGRRLQGALPALLAASLLAAMPAAQVRPVLVNGAAGAVITVQGRPVSLMACTVTGGGVATIDGITDPPRPTQLHLPPPHRS